MGHVAHYKHGQHLFVCDICGFVFHSEKKRIMWNGLVVDPSCYEIRHPQDYVRGRQDEQAVDNPRPDNDDVFLTETSVDTSTLEHSVSPTPKAAVIFLEVGDVTADDL